MSEFKINSKSKRYLKNRKNDIAGIRKCLKARLELACSDITNLIVTFGVTLGAIGLYLYNEAKIEQKNIDRRSEYERN